MTIAKRHRTSKRQLGQFITPATVVERHARRGRIDHGYSHVWSRLLATALSSCLWLASRRTIHRRVRERLKRRCTQYLYGVELDGKLYRRCLQRIEAEFGDMPSEHNLVHGDFFRHEFSGQWRWGRSGYGRSVDVRSDRWQSAVRRHLRRRHRRRTRPRTTASATGAKSRKRPTPSSSSSASNGLSPAGGCCSSAAIRC